MNLYRNVAPSPGRVLGLVRLLGSLADRQVSRRLVCDLMSPTRGPRRGPEPDDIKEILDGARQVGLTEEYQAGGETRVRLAATLSPRLPADLPDLLAGLMLRPTLGAALNHFAAACAWLLTFPVQGAPQGHNAIREGLQAAGFDLQTIDLANQARLDMFLYWAVYLGLIRRFRRSGGHGVLADPTAFLRRQLDQLVPPGERVAAGEFLSRLGADCPVLDGGEVRHSVLGRLHRAGATPWAAHRVSDALSFALRRLARERRVGWEYVNDSYGFFEMSGGERLNTLHRLDGRAA
jgi:hypothetical protein